MGEGFFGQSKFEKFILVGITAKFDVRIEMIFQIEVN